MEICRLKKAFTGNRLFKSMAKAIFSLLMLHVLAMPISAATAVEPAENNNRQIIAYDPSEARFIFKAGRSQITQKVRDILSRHKAKKFERRIKGTERNEEYLLESREAALLAAEAGITADTVKMSSAKLNSRKLNDRLLRLELSDKTDGAWYRFKTDVPKGMMVKKIIRDDGVEIRNGSTSAKGLYYDEDTWYMDGQTLYFYDDPISGYSVVLAPPQEIFSIMVEVPSGTVQNPAGQQSALIYPYNGESDIITDNGTIFYRDHMGRSEDNGIGRDVATGAGEKIALRFTNGANTYEYGNPANPATSMTYDGTAQNRLLNVNYTEYNLNITPWGEPESVIVDNFQQATTNGTRVPFNFTKKYIIRGNKKWYATIYYIKNASATLTANNTIFFQGSDMDFNGDPTNDSCRYDAVNDTVFGFKAVPLATNPSVSYAGFSALTASSAHEINLYTNMWTAVRNGALTNTITYDGDASFALQ